MWTNESFIIVNTKLTNKDLVDNILEEHDYNMDNVDINQLKIGKYKTGNQYSKPSDLGFSPSSDIYGVKFTYNLPR